VYRNFVLRPVNSTSDPYCTLPEWLVFPLRGSTDFFSQAQHCPRCERMQQKIAASAPSSILPRGRDSGYWFMVPHCFGLEFEGRGTSQFFAFAFEIIGSVI
jgi:hypothetical protein